MSKDFTVEELLLVSDIMRNRLDEAHADNKWLWERIKELEYVLKYHDIPFLDYDVWHNELPAT